jgi:hypothetical protein
MHPSVGEATSLRTSLQDLAEAGGHCLVGGGEGVGVDTQRHRWVGPAEAAGDVLTSRPWPIATVADFSRIVATPATMRLGCDTSGTMTRDER